MTARFLGQGKVLKMCSLLLDSFCSEDKGFLPFLKLKGASVLGSVPFTWGTLPQVDGSLLQLIQVFAHVSALSELSHLHELPLFQIAIPLTYSDILYPLLFFFF